ncbi:MAG: gamma-glutamyl-gamma-aminobutyrate hydrolase family protein [Oscillospiraceae bacterium]|nr:gamma-glutamyl-gamma-aminobutyrate hydrolase family protein [Oscillospiraceae bacterium]
MRPIIGMVPLWDSERQSQWMLPGYPEHILRAGGVPLQLPLTDEKEVLEDALSCCQGFLLTGGQDVSPELYGEAAAETCGGLCSVRDAMELHLLTFAMDTGTPVLGICRGIQIMNVFCGGTLWQDLPSQHPSKTEHHMVPPYDRAVHTVQIRKDTPLHTILGCESLSVNSYHHQAVRTLGAGIQVCAVSEDGLVEGISLTEHRFALGVQWHPELRSDAASERIFTALIRECTAQLL